MALGDTPDRGSIEIANAMMKYNTSFFSYSFDTPTLYVDPYIYVRGTPETSTWNPNGTVSDILVM